MKNKFGLNPQVLNEIKMQLTNALQEKTKYTVSVFGSRANATERKYSDLDLLIEVEPELTNKELQALRETFEESDIPIKVDLLPIENCLEDYKDRIFSEKQLWLKY